MSGLIGGVRAKSGVIGTSTPIRSNVPLLGITAEGAIFKTAHASNAHHTWTVSDNSKYLILFQCKSTGGYEHIYPAIASASVNASGTVTITFGSSYPLNGFGSSLTVTTPSANNLKWQNTHTGYSTSATLLKVGGA